MTGKGRSFVTETTSREQRCFAGRAPCDCTRLCSSRLAPNWRFAMAPIPGTAELLGDEVTRRCRRHPVLPAFMLTDQMPRADKLSLLLAQLGEATNKLLGCYKSFGQEANKLPRLQQSGRDRVVTLLTLNCLISGVGIILLPELGAAPAAASALFCSVVAAVQCSFIHRPMNTLTQAATHPAKLSTPVPCTDT